MEIKVNKIEPQTVECFDNTGKSLGFLNEYEFNDLRAQIAENKAEGYHIVFNGKKKEILPTGKIDDWEVGQFDKNEELLCRMFKASRPKHLK